MLNSGAMAITAANVLMRRNKANHVGGSLALSALAAMGVIVSGWFGGRLVYEQGMRVRGVDPLQYDRDAKMLPADERIEHAMHDVEKYIPSAGPVMH
jgi:hypothetical protein